MSNLKLVPSNNLENLKEVKKKYKGIDIPEEIREDEAHLTHVALIRSVPNTVTMEFENSLQIVKLNEQALETTKDHFTRYAQGLAIIIHYGEKHKAVEEKILNVDDGSKEKLTDAENKLKEQDERIKQLEAEKVESDLKLKQLEEAAKKITLETVTEETATEAKKNNGKG